MAHDTFSLWKTRKENTSDDGGVQTSKDEHSPPKCHLASACLRQILEGSLQSKKEIQKSYSQESPPY
jgi:hypothetical protein